MSLGELRIDPYLHDLKALHFAGHIVAHRQQSGIPAGRADTFPVELVEPEALEPVAPDAVEPTVVLGVFVSGVFSD